MNDQYLFVYGTLRRGFEHPLTHLLARQAHFVGRGRFQGRLYDLGSYPGVQSSCHAADVVIGDVYRLYALLQLLATLDHYEKYDPDNPTQSLYLRQNVPIVMEDGRSFHAWIYTYNRPTQGHRLIESGDYLQYLSEKQNA